MWRVLQIRPGKDGVRKMAGNRGCMFASRNSPTPCFQGQGRPTCEEPLLCLMAANIRRFFLRLDIFIVVT